MPSILAAADESAERLGQSGADQAVVIGGPAVRQTASPVKDGRTGPGNLFHDHEAQ